MIFGCKSTENKRICQTIEEEKGEKGGIIEKKAYFCNRKLKTASGMSRFLPLLLALFFVACSSQPDCPSADPLLAEGEEAIRDGRLDDVRAIVCQGQQQAADSDTYYDFVVLDAKRHYYATQTDSFLLCNRRLAAYLHQHPSPRLEVERLLQLGVYNSKMVGDMRQAIGYYQQALDVINANPCLQSNRLRTYTNLADAYKLAGHYDLSVDCYRQALLIVDFLNLQKPSPETTEFSYLITIYCGIASAYAAMGSFEQSRQWWEKAGQLRSHMDRPQLFHYLNNRGNDFYLSEHYAESLRCFLELDSLLQGDSTMYWEQMFGRANLSDVYIKLGNTDRAKELLAQTEPFFRDQQLAVAVYYLNTQRIELALLEGKTDEALRLAQTDGLPLQMQPEQLRLRLKVLVRLYHQRQDWQSYSQANDQLRHLNDSIADGQMKMRFTATLMQYDHEKQMYEKQREVEQNRLSFHLSLALIAALLLVFVLIVVINLQKRRERILKDEAQRSRFMALRMETVRNRITPHFIGNVLQTEMLAHADGQSSNLEPLVNLLHRGIEMTGNEVTTLADELDFIRFYFDVEKSAVGPDLQLVTDIAADVHPYQVHLPSMLIQILVENAIKHGLVPREPRPGRYRTVLIRGTRQQEATLVEVIDNGIGLSALRAQSAKTTSSSIGLTVMKKTVMLLNEQNARHDPQAPQMGFAIEPYTHPDGDTGCRAWLRLPDNFQYTLLNP